MSTAIKREQRLAENKQPTAPVKPRQGRSRVRNTHEQAERKPSQSKTKILSTTRNIQRAYAALLDELGEGALMLTHDGVIQYCNHRFADMMGQRPRRIIGVKFAGFVSPQDQRRWQSLVRSAQRRKRTGRLNLTAQNGNRLVRFSLTSLAPSGVDGLCMVVADTAERAHIQEHLDFRARLLEGMNDAVIAADDRNRITYWNSAAERLYGWTAQEAIGKEYSRVLFRGDSEAALDDLVVRLREQGHLRGEDIHAHRNGSTFDVSYSLTALYDAAGRFSGYVASNRDITERKRTENRALLYAKALESAGNAIVITDRRGTIQWVNPAFTRLTGYTLEESVGQNPRLLKSGRHEPEFYRDLWETILAGLPWHGEMTNKRKDGSLYVEEMSLTPVRQADGSITHFIAIKQDVTERKQAEEAIHKLNRDLEERANELMAANRELEAFSYSVSHDLRAPLRSIDGFSGILLRDYADKLEPSAVGFLDLVRQNAQQMDRLVSDLLALSRSSRQALQRSTVKMDALVHDVLKNTVLTQHDRRIQVWVGDKCVIEADGELAQFEGILPDCEGDAILLKQVWTNLISNAVKFTRTRERARIEIGYQVERETIYYVRDNGIGFDMAHSEHLFGVFQRFHSDEAYEGTGVGLAIVDRIIRRHGGRVWADSQVDEGATFYFALP